MNWTAAFVALGWLLLVLDTIVAVGLTLALCVGELDESSEIMAWLCSVMLAVFFWAGLCVA